METNRRRRAFEERWKQKEEEELRFREHVLQQRKIKFWETTEKFQRGHLPASQHKQIVQTKEAFQLEEALKQIKGSVLTSGLCLTSRNKTTCRTTDDTSYSSASRNGYSHQEQISAMAGLDRTMHESSRASVDSNRLLFQKNLKEMQQLLEKQHLSNLENVHKEAKRTDDSDSLSSLDSLEAGGQKGNYTPPGESSLTTSSDCAPYIPGTTQTSSNDLFCAAQNNSKNMHLNNCQRNLGSRNNHNDLPAQHLLAKRNVLTLAEHADDREEESSVSHRSGKESAEFSTSGNQFTGSASKAFPFLQNIKEERNNSSSGVASTLATGHSVFSSSKTRASPDSVPGERVQDLMQKQSFKMTPQKISKSVQTSTETIATSRILFPNQRCFSGASSPADVAPKDRNVIMDFFKNTSGKVTETKEESIKSIDDIDQGSSLLQDIPNASALCNVKKQNNKEEEKANVVETMSLVSDTELDFGIPAHHSSQKNNIYDRKRTNLVRSLLKKEAEAVVVNHGIVFGTQPVSSIRDILELAKSKRKSAENTKKGVTQPHMSRDNNSHTTKCQLCKAPVSHIPNGDSSQKSCFKASSRMNKSGFFHANSVAPVTKQRQIFNSFENKHRAFTEQRTQSIAPKRWKPTHHTQNSLRTVRLRPVQSASDPAQTMNYTYKSEEVSGSTAQFLTAEKLMSTGATEDEILAAMGSVQPAKQPLLLTTAPRLGMSALSIEEEKILQSLDRLNQRLQNVQEAAARNPSVSRLLQRITSFVGI